MRAGFRELSSAFRACHRTPLNTALHLVTTPLGLFCLLSLLRPAGPAAPAAVYVTALLFILPWRLWLATLLTMAALLGLSLRLEPGPALSLAGIAAAYLGQDLAHYLAGEPTFQNSYAEKPSRVARFLEHSIFLLPLCLDAAGRAGTGGALLDWIRPKNGFLRTHLDQEGDLAAVRAWVEARRPPADATSHWWCDELEPELRQAVERIAHAPRMREMFHARHDPLLFTVDPLPGMNEIYVASLTRRTSSDAVFYRRHVDGPFMLFPFAAVYRCIVALNDNVQIRTSFPMTPDGATLTTGDVAAFDFNREIHRIECTEGARNAGPRITLKLHYCVYPKRLGWYGRLLARLTTRYDIAARRLFLKTLRPGNTIERLLTRVILLCTEAYRLLAEHVGGGGILYLTLLFLADRLTSAPLFLYGSSFIHYLLYIAVYRNREDVAFHTFRRRAMFFKALAAAQLVHLYVGAGRFDPLSLSLIALGLALSGAAARALGMERTYFGAELGLCEPLRLTRFPYGAIPHPMIVGNIVALAGFELLPELRAAAPWLVPAHIALYLLHLLQEEGLVFNKKISPLNSDNIAGM